MRRAPPQTREFAGYLIAHEKSVSRPSEITAPTALLVCAKLRPHLATLMGNAGFSALLSRALALATAEMPALRSLSVNADGSFERRPATGPDLPGADLPGGTILLAHLLDLLATFIGDDLTLRLLREVWPKLPAAPRLAATPRLDRGSTK